MAVINLMNAYAIAAGPWEAQRHWFLMEGESNPSTWFSVTTLTGTAAIAGVCAVVDRSDRRRFWLLCAAGVLAMSFDDAAMVHERVGGNISSAVGGDRDVAFLWVVPWILLALVGLLVLWRTRPGLPPTTRNRMLAAAALIVVSATLLELAAAQALQQYGSQETPKLLLYTLEENLEVIGVLLLARAMWRHALPSPERLAEADAAPGTLGG